MKVRFELLDVTCIAPMKKGDRDALKLFLAVQNDAGDIDKLMSDSEPTIGDPLNVGPYELKKNDTLKLFDKPPIGRSNWLTNPLDFGDQSRLRLALTGFGVHKAELGGGANPDTIFAQVVKAFITSFISLIPKVGDGINKIFEIGIAAAEAEANKNCVGPLFVFNLEYLGADFIIKLLQSGRSLDIDVAAEQSLPVNVSDKCGRPQYRARLRATLADNLFDFPQSFEQSQTLVYKNKTPEVLVESSVDACRQQSPIKAWVVRQETTCRVFPIKKFSLLKYVWKIDQTELREGEGGLSISAIVTRNNPADPLGDYLKSDEHIDIRYRLDQSGNLEIICPDTSGMFALPLSCYLRNEYGEVRLFRRLISIDGEYIAGNPAYDAYASCMHMRALKHIREVLAIKAVLWNIPTDPQPVEAIRMMDDLATIGTFAKTFNSRITKIADKLRFWNSGVG